MLPAAIALCVAFWAAVLFVVGVLSGWTALVIVAVGLGTAAVIFRRIRVE